MHSILNLFPVRNIGLLRAGRLCAVCTGQLHANNANNADQETDSSGEMAGVQTYF